jgi:NAD(P)-dependent dehydrogenase (short-subunit alcohol dehydrogenase family)
MRRVHVSEMRFDGRVAIVTGAGGNPSLGRAYAMLLASRGAKVVVNDNGVGPDGRGTIPAYPEAVVKEIVDAGGEAILDTHSVAEQGSAEAIVQTALDAWGKVDILINNAGVAGLPEFDEMTVSFIEQVLAVHLFGTIWATRAVWPHMKRAGYGRIVGVASNSMLGQRYNTIYGAAKGGIWALMRGLAVEGAAHGIRANSIGPGAKTNMAGLFATGEFIEHAPPAELVAPTVAYLCHESCEVSGGYFEAAAGLTKFHPFAETEGYYNPDVTLEDVRDNFARIMDTHGHTLVPEPLENPMSEIIKRKSPYVPA